MYYCSLLFLTKIRNLYLIIGLHQQNQGEIKIDDIVLDESNLQNWRSQIGYIPQQVYLCEA
jgi:ABC-type bacteriocin/lantibiotic exporter with double-glycine peptidase domain